MNENIQVLFDMGKIEAPIEKLAKTGHERREAGSFSDSDTLRPAI